MRNVTTRVIVFFTGIVVLASAILFDPFPNHLVINVMAILVAALSAIELERLFARSGLGIRAELTITPILGGLLPLVQLLVLFELLPTDAPYLAVVIVTAIALLAQINLTQSGGNSHGPARVSRTVLLLFYPGLFLSFFVRLSEFTDATALILLFLATVFATDTIAYLSGMLYRAIRQISDPDWQPSGIIPASPNKTFVGFVGGWLGAIGIAVLSVTLFQRHMPITPTQAIPIGAAVGLAAILGDLIESALKRSATQKDSGDLIPGRGGVLDSVDSVLYAVPIYYYLVQVLI
jgi:phosphatidate cytidylyltransferase